MAALMVDRLSLRASRLRELSRVRGFTPSGRVTISDCQGNRRRSVDGFRSYPRFPGGLK